MSNLKRKIHSNLSEKNKSTQTKNKGVFKKNKLSIKGRKIHSIQERQKKTNKNSSVLKNKLTKKNLIYFILFLIDIILVIYVARKNVVNYVKISDQKIFVSDTKNLLVGRNYVTLVVTGFFYLYFCIIHCFFFHEKNTKKFLVISFFVLLILNCLLFFLFTKRVY